MNVNLKILWNTVVDDLPNLLPQIEAILNDATDT